MKHLAFLFSILLIFGSATAQKEKKSSGEYQINLSKSELSEAQACEQCKEFARVQAIEKVFGTVIIQGNTTHIRNTQTGEEVQTDQVFNMIAETYVNGDWIETLNEECERFTDGDEFWIKCKVRGTVRELTQPKIDFTIKPLDCTSPTCETFQYKDSESFYLYFKSPVDGYITIFLADPTTAQRILPYRNMPEGMMNAVKVRADKEYILFSKMEDQLGLSAYVDEYELFAESREDLNRVYIIYTSKPLIKPSLYQAESRVEGYKMPMQLDMQNFQKWLSQNRRYHNDMQVERVDITITQ